MKASTPSYLQFQREAARQTVEEFVRKWLLTQQRYQSGGPRAVRVFFADESIDSLARVAPLFLAPREPAASAAAVTN